MANLEQVKEVTGYVVGAVPPIALPENIQVLLDETVSNYLHVVIGSGIGIFYYLRTIFAMTKRTMVTSVVHVPQTAGWTLAAVTLLLLVFGIYPTPVIEWVSRMAQAMT